MSEAWKKRLALAGLVAVTAPICLFQAPAALVEKVIGDRDASGNTTVRTAQCASYWLWIVALWLLLRRR